ncbi:MAG TPA: amidohydrolase family protein, partial [Chloroflexota bacterium]|nr:amidohydrolase family protein [Chloroflexota bacterium]
GAATALAGGAQTQIVDAHVHLWDNTCLRVPWIDANAVLNRPYLPADYTEHTTGTGTAALVYVEVAVAPPYAALEPDWVLARARLDPRIQGMVVWAPVEFGELARAYLEAMVAKGPLVKGVRRGLGNDPALATSADFVRGVQLLGEHGLSFDLLGRGEPVMGAAIELVRRCPGTQFMVDHLFNPDVRQGTMDPWRGQLAALAAFPNVSCKVSGVVTNADHEGWRPADLAPYVDHALSVFGEDRVAYGSDWPVILQAATIPRWVDALDGIVSRLSPGARRKLFGENARRFYRLESA